ncbi:MAG: GFA family protein [Steroidobacteraceae bacterium]
MSDEVPGAAAIEGGCLCGAVRYRISGRPLYSVICHCVSCRRASGAPTVAWLTVERNHFEWLSGRPQPFASSPGVLRCFCRVCGSPLTYETGTSPNSVDVTSASLDDANLFPPTREVWLEHRLSWQPVNPALAPFQQDSAAAANSKPV